MLPLLGKFGFSQRCCEDSVLLRCYAESLTAWLPTFLKIFLLQSCKRMRWVAHVARMGDKRGAYRVLVGITEKNELFERPRHRWEGNIRINLQRSGMGRHGLDCCPSG